MASKIFLPLRLAKWGNFELFNTKFGKTDIEAGAISVKGSRGANIFAIEDGNVEQIGNNGLLISDEDEKPNDDFIGRQWTYGNVVLTKTGKVKAGDKIGKVVDNKDLRLSIQTDDDVVQIGEKDDIQGLTPTKVPINIEVPQNPLPALIALKVEALPIDAKEVDESSDEPSELGDQKRKAKGPSALKTVGTIAGLGLLTYGLYKIIK